MTISTELKKFSIPAVLSLGILFSPVGEAQAATLSPEPQPIDLSTWTQEGVPANGKWVVSADGASVLQTINNNPTFFVSPDEFIDTTIQGKLKVEGRGDNDDDFIGFVFGYQSPIATNNDGVNDFDFLLFDWKQKTQRLAQEGFSLVKVNGAISNYDPNFWDHKSSSKFDLIATDYGSSKGWQDRTEYDFTLLYESDRVKIDIDGNTIFDISADEVGGEFQPGRFGFYNFSQEAVRYSGFTQKDTSPTPPETERVPEPSSVLGLLAFSAVGLAGLKRKKQHKSQDDSVS
ncbi:MAG: PEP-CTERM sorting domain-containing protein [Hormoscilla sp.]